MTPIKTFTFILLFIFCCALSEASTNLPNTTLPPAPTDTLLLVNELNMIDNLIEITKKNLNNQEELRKLVVDYKENFTLYLNNSSNKEIVLKVAKKAHHLLEQIKKNYLLTAFEPDFISELTLFSQLALKKGIPKS